MTKYTKKSARSAKKTEEAAEKKKTKDEDVVKMLLTMEWICVHKRVYVCVEVNKADVKYTRLKSLIKKNNTFFVIHRY